MKVTIDVEHLAEVSELIKACDQHWRGPLVLAGASLIVALAVAVIAAAVYLVGHA